MSATISPVVSPRKGRHNRSKGATVSQSPFSSHGSTSLIGAVQAALPPNVDPLNLDPDEAFVKLSVREVQTIESNLQSSHDALSTKLRSLVSERYRDMLGTANTLIEMSSSATNLVKRLDAVREGIDKVRTDPEGKGEEGSMSMLRDHLGDEAASSEEERLKSIIFSIAAATKLLAESPDEVWRAIDSASWNSISSGTGKRALRGRELSNFKAATALRAAWIYIICQEAWDWLSKGLQKAALDDEVEPKFLFPFISKQWETLSPMQSGIANVARIGMTGWFPTDFDGSKKWEEVSSSYMATVTFMLTIALLETCSITTLRDRLLQNRKEAIEEQLHQSKQSPSLTLSHLLKCIADTMIQCFRAFVLPNVSSDLPDIARYFKVISSEQGLEEVKIDFPPLANHALSTLPSNTLFLDHLPSAIRSFTPPLGIEDAKSCQQSTPRILRKWVQGIRDQGKENMFSSLINKLDTIASIGEAQSHLWDSLDQCLVVAEMACKEEYHSFKSVFEEELRTLAELLDGLLLKRLDSLCYDRATELSKIVSQSTSMALESLKGVQNGQEENIGSATLERSPLKFVFEADMTSSSLSHRLRVQTPLAQQVVSSLEEKTQSLLEEIGAYTSYVENGAFRREKRMQRRKREEDGKAILQRQEERTREVLDSYQKAFDAARLSLVTELGQQVKRLDGEATEYDGTSHLLLTRIVSALQNSRTLGGKKEDSATKQFHQDLATLRKDVLAGWVAHVVEEAIGKYCLKVQSCLERQTDDHQGQPSSALVDSLIRLVDGIHAVGCGYNSEMLSLGQQFASSFVESWLKLSTKLNGKEEKLYKYDSQVLLVLLKVPLGANEVIAKLEKSSGDSLIAKQEQIESALYRLRLILLPLGTHLGSFTSTNNMSDKKVLGDGPPLPKSATIR